MELYEKVMVGKRTTYKPYVEPGRNTEIEMDNNQIVSLAGTIGTCLLIGLERQLKPHSLLARRIKNVEESLQQLAQISGGKLDQRMFDAGIAAWGAAIDKLGEELSKNG